MDWTCISKCPKLWTEPTNINQFQWYQDLDLNFTENISTCGNIIQDFRNCGAVKCDISESWSRFIFATWKTNMSKKIEDLVGLNLFCKQWLNLWKLHSRLGNCVKVKSDSSESWSRYIFAPWKTNLYQQEPNQKLWTEPTMSNSNEAQTLKWT